jgi:hypothetical protein
MIFYQKKCKVPKLITIALTKASHEELEQSKTIKQNNYFLGHAFLNPINIVFVSTTNKGYRHEQNSFNRN